MGMELFWVGHDLYYHAQGKSGRIKMNDPIQAAVKALKAYQAAYDQLTDGKSVQALLNLLAKIEANSPNGITAKITRKQILKTRQKQRPDLPTPLSLKDNFVRRVVRTLEATDFEQVLGERIEDLERDLEYAKAPKNLHEKMLCLLDTGIDKNTVGSVVCSFFDGIREGKNICCLKEPNIALLSSPEDVTSLSCIDGGDGQPFLVVLTSPDSPRHPDDTTPAVVFPMAKIMDGLRKYEVIRGVAFDPWDRGGLLLKRDFLLGAWDRNEAYHQHSNQP